MHHLTPFFFIEHNIDCILTGWREFIWRIKINLKNLMHQIGKKIIKKLIFCA
jgi:hypothetical protein